MAARRLRRESAVPTSEDRFAAATPRPVADRRKILIYGLNFAPELTGVGRYTGDMAAWLREQGHAVVVVTSYPYYPTWRLSNGYTNYRWSVSDWQGVKVIRCPLWVPRRQTTVCRLLHLMSFALSSAPAAMIAALRHRPDVVMAIEPTSFAGPGGLLAARVVGARAWLHVQDLELGAALNLGLVGNSAPVRLVRRLYGWLLSRFCHVSTLTGQMRRTLAAFGRSADRITLFPNWVDTESCKPVDASALRTDIGIASDDFVVLYSGNMGEKQGVEGLLDAAAVLQKHCRIRFVLCGAGTARKQIEKRIAAHPNVMLLDPQPEERFVELLSLADCHVLPQKRGVTNYVMPSKLGPMLASGKPVIAQAEFGDVIHREFGHCCAIEQPEHPAALARRVLELHSRPLECERLGAAGRAAVQASLSRDAVLRRFETGIGSLLAEPEGATRTADRAALSGWRRWTAILGWRSS